MTDAVQLTEAEKVAVLRSVKAHRQHLEHCSAHPRKKYTIEEWTALDEVIEQLKSAEQKLKKPLKKFLISETGSPDEDHPNKMYMKSAESFDALIRAFCKERYNHDSEQLHKMTHEEVLEYLQSRSWHNSDTYLMIFDVEQEVQAF